MMIGYARVSTRDQNLDLQLESLKQFGCEEIFSEKISAAKERPDLEKMISILRKGDVGELKFCTFTQICNGLVGWSPQSPTLHILKIAKHVNIE